eukprot:gene6452-7116_t
MNSLQQVFQRVKSDYLSTKNKKFLMVDALIAYTLATALLQIVYVVLVGNFPFNSFLSGLFCHLGIFTLAVSLRLQLSSSEFSSVAPEKAFGDFAFSVAVLLFVVFSFLG